MTKVQKILPEHTPDMVADILALRGKKLDDLTSTDISDDLLDDLVEPGEQGDFKDF